MNPQNKPHPHAELIHAWADGKTIQIKKDNGEWEDCLLNRPAWNERTEYRIKPSNKPWMPKGGEKYFYLGVFDGKIGVESHRWDYNEVDNALYLIHNIFPTKEEAEAAIHRVEVALKGDFATDTNVGSKSEIDGKPLTDGEIALIKTLRRGRIFQQYVDPRAVVVEALKDGNMKIHHEFVAFCMHSCGDTARIRSAIKLIKAEQEARGEA